MTLPHPRYAIATQQDVAYGPLPAEKLDLCLPEKAAGVRPGVILVHGGAWTGGDKATLSGPCHLLAQQGFVAATVNYRLGVNAVASTQWPTQLVDVQLAVRWLRFQAPGLNLDPQRIGAWGSSAGGHLAVFLGSLKTIRPGDQAQLLANESPAVSPVVDEFGPVDLTDDKDAALNGSFLTLFGASYQQNPAAYRDASPIFSLNSQSAPTLIIQGTQDGLVPPAQSIELQQALEKNRVPVQYISYNAGHGFHGLTKAQQLAIVAQEVNYLIGLEHP
jgi:acetyl esterase/lipase